MILLTTSRRPTDRMRTFCRDLVNSIPDFVRVNRGKMSQDGVTEKAIEYKADRVIVVNRWREGTLKIKLFKVSSTGLRFVSPLMLISDIRIRREFKEATRHARASVITMEPETSPELGQFAGSLSQYLGLPILSMDRASTRHHVSMHFLFDSSRQLQVTFMFLSRMVEIGPRLTVSKLSWEVQS